MQDRFVEPLAKEALSFLLETKPVAGVAEDCLSSGAELILRHFVSIGRERWSTRIASDLLVTLESEVRSGALDEASFDGVRLVAICMDQLHAFGAAGTIDPPPFDARHPLAPDQRCLAPFSPRGEDDLWALLPRAYLCLQDAGLTETTIRNYTRRYFAHMTDDLSRRK